MEIQRCPECGIRLKSNYCDVCMKKVPFKGVPARKTWQPKDASSAHREEDHECISFDEPEKRSYTRPKSASSRRQTNGKTQKAKVVAIVIAVMSVISSVFGILDEAIQPEPDYGYEEIIEAGEIGAETVPAIETRELYNDGAIIVTADFAGLYYDDYTVFMTVINESTSDVIVSTDLLSVNGFMHSGSFYAQVGSGETVQESLQLYAWELDQAGIDQVEEIAFYLDIYDAESFEDIAGTDLITLETEIADTYEQPEFMDGWELYRSDDLVIRIVSTGAYYGNCDVQMYMQNLSDRTISVSAPSILVNGLEADGSLWCTLRSGTQALSGVYLYDLTDEAGETINSLDQIREITLDLHIEYMEDWYVAETINETVTFNPNDSL